MTVDTKETTRRIERAAEILSRVSAEVGRAVVGQRTMMDRLLVGLLTGGHVLLEGVPGLAKTLAVRSLADTLALKFRRIQFTPDLLPADLTGTLIYNPRDGSFSAKRGPVFAHLVLADEINRAPAKVQAALLEAMQEKQVTLGDDSHVLEEPFLVLATQNPIEQEGTYPLPEAQSDRFMLKVKIGYPDRNEEKEILRRAGLGVLPALTPQVSRDEVLETRQALAGVYVDDKLQEYVLDLVTATRRPGDYGLAIDTLVAYGASPRATLFLVRGAQALAVLDGRPYVLPEDIKAIAPDVLRHRIHVSYEAEAEGVDGEEIARRILERVRVP
ncbi:MAG: MoxR family ATPase [Candidatus Eisenbacteria bacterium]|uniref:MoxR family ATPase n=1 Tax=Eiseniibacteriota bacterium TaxID=2212470 RepID=A0A538TYD0_UNCEI|nr:MAG: MoxR family ATPase [Candidatus Eisenbacteria bacterium]